MLLNAFFYKISYTVGFNYKAVFNYGIDNLQLNFKAARFTWLINARIILIGFCARIINKIYRFLQLKCI